MGPRVLPTDHTLMQRALELAQRGMGLAHPNPYVGAIVVRGHQKLGEGFHEYSKTDHAEILALRQAGEKARGATMYVTLEPCCTTGRTGPCTQAMIAAGIRRVVVPMKDPNPAVAGQGLTELRRAGIGVDLGLDQEKARRLNEDFAKWIRTGVPFVTLKAALTLDGQIAVRSGHPARITGDRARQEVHRLRHSADALLTGIGTVLADDPLLTDRSGWPRRRPLLRVILDSKLRIPLGSRIVKSAERDVLVLTAQPANSRKARALEERGLEVLRVAAPGGRMNLGTVLRKLGAREILHVLLEAGAELNGTALKADLVDRVVLFYAPKIMGTGGVPMAQIAAEPWFGKAPALTNLSVNPCRPDFVVEGYFHDVYRNHRSRRAN
ncbi:MAG TPA: bifunctional diaminohydroxyphosphoribosylaminopyrimidine deaminase/5-amino-6-(5-phosphoribosylamino)uracil reductase RibD [Candidatus Acidoferrales bacterium]|nr:bifunctional diaminohydroxyphosphoribosylaminopyrimidine deaminase/5-amino-6-(5-phosphoribosylamino)uracil reductase RibD [Candidatus Acidoferrales bacterium]